MAEIRVKNLRDAELASIYEDSTDGKTYRRTTAKGEFKPEGMTDWRITTLEVTSSQTPLPSIAFTDRRSLTVFNASETDVLYIGSIGVTANRVIGTTAGWEIQPNSSINIDFAADVTIYGIAESSKTILVKIMEIA